jgi:hypothetical protein
VIVSIKTASQLARACVDSMLKILLEKDIGGRFQQPLD